MSQLGSVTEDRGTTPGASPAIGRKGPSAQVRRILRVGLLTALTLAILGTLAVGGFVFAAWRAMPAMETLVPKYLATSFLYDRDGQQVTGLAGPENRIPVSINQMSEPLKQAFIAHEDRYFYNHNGIVLRAIVRAMYSNLTGGQIQGGSTITQQLARTAFLTLDRTLTRKVQEAIVAIQLEGALTKDKILEMYLNQINLGHGGYGVEAAARNYFGKSASELNVAEAAMIAGIAKSPGTLSPYRNWDRAKEQQLLVLSKMAREGFISHDEEIAAAQAELTLPGLTSRTDYPYPFFVDHVLDQLINVYKLDTDLIYSGGLKIYTTLDVDTQAAAEAAVAKYSVNFPTNKSGERAEVGMVIMENETGYLRAIVGGVEHAQQLQFNFATQAKRQPGSAFKPIVDYTPAIDKGYSPATVVDDAPAVWAIDREDSWQPVNYDDRFRGLVTLRYALERSINIPAAKVLTLVGIETGVSYAQRMGIDNLVTAGPLNDLTWSLSIGALTYGVSALEMTRAYAVLANQGVKVQTLGDPPGGGFGRLGHLAERAQEGAGPDRTDRLAGHGHAGRSHPPELWDGDSSTHPGLDCGRKDRHFGQLCGCLVRRLYRHSLGRGVVGIPQRTRVDGRPVRWDVPGPDLAGGHGCSPCGLDPGRIQDAQGHCAGGRLPQVRQAAGTELPAGRRDH